MAVLTIQCKIEKMSFISEHLTSLRQEITTLRTLNARYSEKSEHSPIDQSALELRTNRLLEIKKELSRILDRPGDPSVWWEKSRGQGRAT
jgi:hypothetical protein